MLHNIYIYIWKLLILVLFMLSNLGYWEYLRRHLKVDSCFFPSITIAFQTSALFLAGILNMLPEASYILYAFGIFYCLFSFVKYRGKDFFVFYFKPAYFVLVISFCVAAVYLHGQFFLHYDNFSHWALVVKQMLSENRFPNFADGLIMFQEYPLGSSVYIYYFAKLTSGAESMQMLAQCFVMLCALMPCFAFCKKDLISTTVVMLLFTAFILTFNIEITELLVDTLLPIVGGAAFIFTLSHLYGFRRGNADIKQGKVSLWIISFYLIQLIQIKNSGLFFAIMVSIVTVILLFPKRKKLGAGNIISFVLPYFTFFIWHKHCKYVFISSGTSYHAMTAENFARGISLKTKEEILSICRAMINFSVSDSMVIITAISVLFACAGSFVLLYFMGELSDNRKQLIVHCVTFCIFTYIIYQFGLLLMYLFSMSSGEAIRLAGGTRYCKTILIFIFYITITMALTWLSLDICIAKRRVLTSSFSVALSCAILVATICMNNATPMSAIDKRNSYQDSTRAWLERVSTIYNVPQYSSYGLILHDTDSGYSFYLMKYIFQSVSIQCTVVDDYSDLSAIDNCEYIFVMDKDNEIVNDWINANYPAQAGQDVIFCS